MKRTMAVGKRITLGFIVIILVMLVIGIVAVYNMHEAHDDSELLAHEYVPEVRVASDLRGAANRVMYEMRGYGFTKEDSFYQNAQTEFNALQDALQACKDLDKEASHLEKLGGQIVIAEGEITTYTVLARQTKSAIDKLNEERASLDANAAILMTAL